MLKLIKILPVFLLGIPAFNIAQDGSFAQKILDKLYKQYGNKIIIKPSVSIIQDEKIAAQFRRDERHIEISERLIKVCRKYGKDSSAALAFVLGHELAHAYQLDLKAKKTSFLAYSSAENSSHEHEEMADISGGFMAYLAEYKTLDILEHLIEDIYKEFELEDNMYGYPSLDERKKTAIKVKKMIKELIQVYEAGNYFTAIGKYELAIACFEYINKWYKGKEIYNNLGVNYAYRALNFSRRNADEYIYPMEINWNTRLKKSIGVRGTNVLTPSELSLRRDYLMMSERNLIESSIIDPENFTTEVNLMILYIIKGQPREAIKYYETNELSKKKIILDVDGKSDEQSRMALALAFLGIEENDKSRRIWTDIANTSKSIFAEQARHNLSVMDRVKPKLNKNEPCVRFTDVDRIVDEVRLSKWQSTEKSIVLDAEEGIELSVQKLPSSTVYSVKTPSSRFNMQRINGSWKAKASDVKKVRSSLLITGGTVYHCEAESYAVVIGDKNEVKEYVKYTGERK